MMFANYSDGSGKKYIKRKERMTKQTRQNVNKW